MTTEITKGRLKENFYPSKNFYREVVDGAIVDYAEIEIDPDGIQKLEDKLDRCKDKSDFEEEYWNNINNPESDDYEYVIAYVHFDAGTDNFNKLFVSVITVNKEIVLDADELLNSEEKQNIINAGLQSLHKWRKTDMMLDQKGYEIKQIVEERRLCC